MGAGEAQLKAAPELPWVSQGRLAWELHRKPSASQEPGVSWMGQAHPPEGVLASRKDRHTHIQGEVREGMAGIRSNGLGE